MKKFATGCLILVSTAAAASAFSQGAPAPRDHGRQVYERWCTPCHGRQDFLPGTSALAVKYKGKIPAALEDRKDLTAAVVKAVVRQGAFSMAPFRKTEISDADLDALAAYLSKRR